MPTKQAEAKKSENKMEKRRGRFSDRRGRREEPEFDQKIIDVSRVTRVTEGGKQMSFRATVAIGDHKGRVGMGIGKGLDVTAAINKAVSKAKKSMIVVPMTDKESIPHEVITKFGAAKVAMRPAPAGTGIIAGGVMRMILELSGVKNVRAKMYGSPNKINNSKATIQALTQLHSPQVRKAMLKQQ